MAAKSAGADDGRDAYLSVLVAQALDDVAWNQLAVVEALRMCAEYAWDEGFRVGLRGRDGTAASQGE